MMQKPPSKSTGYALLLLGIFFALGLITFLFVGITQAFIFTIPGFIVILVWNLEQYQKQQRNKEGGPQG